MLRVAAMIAFVLATSSADAAWHFSDVTAEAGLTYQHGYVATTSGRPTRNPGGDVVGATAADYDRDGDLDLFLTHWSASYFNLLDTSSYHLWRNDGAGGFTDVTLEAGIRPTSVQDRFDSFTANFVDIDGDGW